MDFPFSNAHLTARLVVEADFDPQFPSRVLHRFAERGTLPLRFLVTASEDDGVRVDVEFAGTLEAARLLSRRVLNLPSARSVDLSFRRESTLAARQLAA